MPSIRNKAFLPGKSRSHLVIITAFLAAHAFSQLSTQPNRKVPKIEQPGNGLILSAHPTTEDIFRAHIFEEPLAPVNGAPMDDENSDLAAALRGYSKRSGPDDFSALTDFLQEHPQSPWVTALLTDLGLEYYNTAHYSLAIDAWNRAWSSGKNAKGARARAIVDRAVSELAFMCARLGRMNQIEDLLNSTTNRPVIGSSAQRMTGAREGLWMMQNRPQVAFRCGPLALERIRLATNLRDQQGEKEIFNSASTQKGFALSQVADLSKKVGLNYQMAFREKNGEFVVPSVVHWKVGHYAAMVRKEGGLYLLQDPTFGNETWATKAALDAETSGYFLIPPGALPAGWRSVSTEEGGAIWGKGQTSGNDPKNTCPRDFRTHGGTCRGMAVPSIHLMEVSLNVVDTPVGYTPPVGPPVNFTVRYNQRDAFQPGGFNFSNVGSQWTSDWITYVIDNPSNLLADVNIYVGGGGDRLFTGFNTNSQTFAPQQYDQTLLKRTSPSSYELLYSDGSKSVFGQSDGSSGTSRRIFLTQQIDPQGNAVSLTYDSNLRIVALTDAIGQVTTLNYDSPADNLKITKVTDPFGRFASFTYDADGRLTNITDVIGLSSQFVYFDYDILNPQGMIVEIIPTAAMLSLTTPYGTTSFNGTIASFVGGEGNTRALLIVYPDSSLERVEYNQNVTNQPMSDPQASVPVGMATFNNNLRYRDTYYWDRTACAVGYGDYSKARIYHWCHTEDLTTTSGALESIKKPLEGRVWFNYAGQNGASYQIASNTLPTVAGRVLDDGQTQLFTHGYNRFGHVTNSIDPLGRTFSYVYDTNGIDLLEVRQTRAVNNELLARMTYNSQHRVLTMTDAAGQTTTFTYNARGQVLTTTNPKQQTVACSYDPNGYLLSFSGPLPTSEVFSFTYDSKGRVRTLTSVSGSTLTYDYDDLDRLTRLTHPDGTFDQSTYDRLDCVAYQDRAGRTTSFEYDNMRQLTTQTDPLARVIRFGWCRCGAIKSFTDPLGRTTTWLTDVQGRRIGKQYPDGSQIQFIYDNTISRLHESIDEKQQSIVYTHNLDNTVKSIAYGNTAVPTPNVSFTYDPNYERVASMSDGIGTTTYSYYPITSPPALGAARLESVEGPLPNEAFAYAYDELGRPVQTAIDGVISTRTYDGNDRVASDSNVLGFFAYSYDASSLRLASETFPNGQSGIMNYGGNLQDFELQQITYANGPNPISQFVYGRDARRHLITSWAQQAASQPPSVFSFAYDTENQLVSAYVTNSGVQVNTFGYSYDPSANRLSEVIGGSSKSASFNSLNQLSAVANAAFNSRTNEWDGQHRLAAVTVGTTRTEFGYDGVNRLAFIRQLQNGSQVSFRRFVSVGDHIVEERDASGATVTKRFFSQGVKLETGPSPGPYYYTRDHLGSVREMTDSSGGVRARYSYDPFGRKTKLSGDLDADFGFAGMFWSPEASLALTHFRAYDPELGRWLSRDSLKNAEAGEGPNLYAYVRNNPVNLIDRSGKVPTWMGISPEIGAPFGPDAITKLASEIQATTQEAADPIIQQTTQMTAEDELRSWAQELLAKQAADAPSFWCQNISNLADVGLGEAGPLLAAAAAGVGVGVTLDYETDVDEWFADQGVAVEQTTGSRVLGGIATLEVESNPIGWYAWLAHEIAP